MLINIEGLSGSGKSTLVEKLKELMQSKIDNEVVFLGGFDINNTSTELTKLCSEIVKKNMFFNMPITAELHLLIAELILDIELNVLPNINSGNLVIYTNYWQSIQFFESAIAKVYYPREIHYPQYINEVFQIVERNYNILSPTLTIFVNSTISDTIKRIQIRDQHIKPDIYRLQANILQLYEEKLNYHRKIVINNLGSLKEFYSEINVMYENHIKNITNYA